MNLSMTKFVFFSKIGFGIVCTLMVMLLSTFLHLIQEKPVQIEFTPKEEASGRS